MSDNLEEGLSPSEAARILSQSRWGGDEHEQAPPEQPKEADPYKAPGFTDFTSMNMAVPIQGEQFDDPPSVPHPGENPVNVTRQYQDMGDGRPKPLSESVSAEQAAQDLSNTRRAEAEALRQAEDQAIADLMKSELDGQQPQQVQEPIAIDQQVQQPQEQQQPVQAQDDSDADHERYLSAHPRFTARIQEHVTQQTAQATAEAQRAHEYYMNAAAQNGNNTLAIVQAVAPELGNDPNRWAENIRVVAHNNPERGQWLANLVTRGMNILNEQARNQQTQAQQNWNSFAKNEDAKFLASAPELQDSDKARKTADGALQYLKDIGFSEQELGNSWNGQASVSLRDHRIQLLIRDGLRYREAQAGARNKADRPVPVVQRPGSPTSIAPQADVDYQKLSQRLDGLKGNAAARAGAVLIAARRARR